MKKETQKPTVKKNDISWEGVLKNPEKIENHISVRDCRYTDPLLADDAQYAFEWRKK